MQKEHSEIQTDVKNTTELRRYTYRQLNTQAKQAFRRIQMNGPDGGAKQDYRFKSWDILINNGSVSQILNYDVTTPEKTLKRSGVIVL